MNRPTKKTNTDPTQNNRHKYRRWSRRRHFNRTPIDHFLLEMTGLGTQ